MTTMPPAIYQHWPTISPLLSLRNDDEYERAIACLDSLLDEVGTDEQHPLYTLVDTLGTLLHAYEEQHHPIPPCPGFEVLQFLMDEHQLTPADLPELGTPSEVAAILQGERELTVPQLRGLAERFRVSPAVFL